MVRVCSLTAAIIARFLGCVISQRCMQSVETVRLLVGLRAITGRPSKDCHCRLTFFSLSLPRSAAAPLHEELSDGMRGGPLSYLLLLLTTRAAALASVWLSPSPTVNLTEARNLRGGHDYVRQQDICLTVRRRSAAGDGDSR